MAPLLPWADLNPDLLILIAERLDIKCYASARGACRSWRRALTPPFPALLEAAEDDTMSFHRLSAASLLLHRSFKLAAIASRSRCVGSSNGWLALCIRVGRYYDRRTAFFLVNPVTGVEIALPLLFYENMWISKVVFAPNPTEDDFAAVGICNADRIIYVTAGAKSWAVLSSVCITYGDQLTDLIYHDEGKVYCLTMCGDVHILHLPERRRQKPAIVEDPKLSVLRPPQGIEVWQPHRLNLNLDVTVPVTSAPHWRRHDQDHLDLNLDVTVPVTIASHWRHDQDSTVQVTIDPYWTRSAQEAQGPDLNAPARVEPLLSVDSHWFSLATAFAPPYDVVSVITNAKHLVFCEGNLYQVWRNTSCTVTLRVPGLGQRPVCLGEVFVLRYYPQRRPCWDVVKDLGGYSFFVGRNNAVSVYAKGAPGLRGNCVYWIDGHGREKGMVFDMQTGRSMPCGYPESEVGAPGYARRSCWYFLSDTVTTDSSDGGRRDTLSIQQ